MITDVEVEVQEGLRRHHIYTSDIVGEALSKLYCTYYRDPVGDIIKWRLDVEEALADLMIAYYRWLG